MRKWTSTTIFVLSIFGILFSLLITSVALASGVGFTPGKLEMDSTSEGMSATLYVINTGKQTANYIVYADEPNAGWFEISPSEFPLGPSENMPIKISLSPTEVPLGEHHAKIYVVAFADTMDARVGTGAKVPVHITLTSPISKPAQRAQSEASLETSESFSVLDEESTDSPVRVELWIGLVVVVAVISATAVVFLLRRRKRVEIR